MSVRPFIVDPHVSIDIAALSIAGGPDLLDFLKPPVQTFQDFIVLTGRAFRNIFRAPHYVDDILLQMDTIGVGSLPIVMLIGLFSGLIMGLQMARALAHLRRARADRADRFLHSDSRTGAGAGGAAGGGPQRQRHRQRTRIDESDRADRRHARAGHRSDSETGDAAADRDGRDAAAADRSSRISSG